MSQQSYLPLLLLAHDQVVLGDLVVNLDTPWHNFRSFPKGTKYPEDYSHVDLQLGHVLGNRVKQSLSGNVGSNFRSVLDTNETSFRALQAMSSVRTLEEFQGYVRRRFPGSREE